MSNEPSNPADYFASLLGDANPANGRPKPRRTTVVTPATVARVHAEQAADAFAAEREALNEEIENQRAVVEALALELAEAKESLETANNALAAAKEESEAVKRELAISQEALEREKSVPRHDPALLDKIADGEREIERLQALLAEAQRTSLSSTVLLEKPDGVTEKFTGEIREHLLEALADAQKAADAGGRDRRARILEAILFANARTGELARRRDAVKQIMKDAGSFIDDSAIAELEKLGFRYVSGANHHKLDFAGIRFPVSKTPGDRRSCLNSAAEICNRVF